MNIWTGSVIVGRVAGGQKYISDVDSETLSCPNTPKQTVQLQAICLMFKPVSTSV